MLDRINSIIEGIKKTKTWSSLIQLIVTSIIIIFLTAPREFVDMVRFFQFSHFNSSPSQYLENNLEQIEEIVRSYDRIHNYSLGLGFYDRDHDILISYLDQSHAYIWDTLAINVNSRITIKPKKFLTDKANLRCSYISPNQDIYFKGQYHIGFCKILADQAIVFSFIDSHQSIDESVLLTNLSNISNKIERKIINLD